MTKLFPKAQDLLNRFYCLARRRRKYHPKPQDERLLETLGRYDRSIYKIKKLLIYRKSIENKNHCFVGGGYEN
jgi:hypothetical protein